MPKNDNAHALRLYTALADFDRAAADCFARERPLSKSADYWKKFQWAKDQCAFLEERFSPEDVAAIRARCSCEDGAGKIARFRKYWEKSQDIPGFCALHNQKESYGSLEPCEGGLLLIYPQCYCSCVKRVDEPISRSWCLCTLGNARAIFSGVFGRPVGAQLVETVKSGGARCVIKITI